MKKRKLLSILSLFFALTIVLVSTSVALADKGGFPNEKAANGAAHANENSVHTSGDGDPGDGS